MPNGASTTSVTIAGKNWNLWVGTSSGVPCYSYVAQQNLNSLSFDLNLFIKDAVSRGYIQATWGLTNVFAGFEIWNGGVGPETLWGAGRGYRNVFYATHRHWNRHGNCVWTGKSIMAAPAPPPRVGT